jgi:hypothetical protein
VAIYVNPLDPTTIGAYLARQVQANKPAAFVPAVWVEQNLEQES